MEHVCIQYYGLAYISGLGGLLKAIQTEFLSRNLKANGLGFKRMGMTQVWREDNDILSCDYTAFLWQEVGEIPGCKFENI